MLKYSYFIALSFCFRTVQGQGLDSVIKSAIGVLRQQKVDTIIEIRFPDKSNSISNDTLIGIGIVHALDIRYLIYKMNDTVYSKKFVEYCSRDCIDLEDAVSKVYQSTYNTLFLWLRANLGIVRNENLFPYIAKQEHNGIAVYTPLVGDRMPWYDIEFYINEERFGKAVYPVDLNEEFFSQLENLNYKYNQQTKLSEFFYLLTVYIAKIDSKYIF
jgi:hypothetical protein